MTTPTNSLDDLILKLNSLTRPLEPSELTQYLGSLNPGFTDISRWRHFNEELYARNQVLRARYAELIVMCWRSGQLTPIHDHRGSACGIRVLEGTATEISYRTSAIGFLVPSKSESFHEGSVLSSYDTDIHQMGNIEDSGSDLVTLHCYSPPLTGMQMFDASKTFFAGYQNVCSKSLARMQRAKSVQVGSTL